MKKSIDVKRSMNVAEALAADLAGAGVDPNEAQKALAYLRSKRNGKALFEYLQAVVTNGNVVVRSRQTLNYYHELQSACQRHLRPLQDDYQHMALAFGWSLRLLRYNRVVPAAAREEASRQPKKPGNEKPRTGDTPPDKTPPSGPSHPPGRQLPQVGDIITGKVLERNEKAIVIQVPGFDTDQVVAVLNVEPGVPKYRPNKDSARVQVTGIRQIKKGKTVLDVKRPMST